MADLELITQFKLIAGIDLNDDDDKVASILQVHNNDVNNALSTYFDSQFDSIIPGPPILDSPNVESPSILRRVSMHASRPQSIHSLFMLESMVPRLARAPTIADSWRLDLITAQLIARNSANGINAKKPSPTPKFHSFLIWLLVIPRRLWLLLCSLLGYFSGINLITERASIKFDPTKYTELDIISRIKRAGECRNVDDTKSGASETTEKTTQRQLSSAESTTETNGPLAYQPLEKESGTVASSRPSSILEQYNISCDDFNVAHREAQQTYSWLLIFLAQSGDSGSEFLSKILHDERFHRTFNKKTGQESDTIIYAATPESDPQAWAVARAYRARKYPCVVLIGNVLPLPQEISLLMLVVSKLVLVLSGDQRGNVAPMVEAMLENFKKQALDPYSPQLVAARFDKREQEFARLLKQQQDDAYTQSLVQDRVKREAKNMAGQRQSFLFTQAQEQWCPLSKPDERKVRLAVKVPSGNRFVATVPESATVRDIYLLAELEMYRALKTSLPANEPDGSITTDNYYELFPPKFELIQPFPKKVVLFLHKPICEIAELKSGASLIVEMDDESDQEA